MNSHASEKMDTEKKKCVPYELGIRWGVVDSEVSWIQNNIDRRIDLEKDWCTGEARPYEKIPDEAWLNNNDSSVLLISFDLENAFSFPCTHVGSVYYKRKFNIYLTVRIEQTTKEYNAIWEEPTAGRHAKDLASAVIHVLK